VLTIVAFCGFDVLFRSEKETKTTTAHETYGESTTRALNAIATKAPANVKPYIEKATPIIAKVFTHFIAYLSLLLLTFHGMWNRLLMWLRR
jgi:hypothetical protein